MKKGKVTGIGGVFFKTKDPVTVREWYNKHLGMVINEYGSLFEFGLGDAPEKRGYLQWSPMDDQTDYFEPSEQPFMINYRVKHIEVLVESLKAQGVEVVDEIETYEYGKFVHIMDPVGNKLELWEPVDEVFTESHGDQVTK